MAEAARAEADRLFAAGNHSTAAALYASALAHAAEGHEQLHNDLSACFHACGLFASALEHAEAAITAAPRLAKAHYWRGAALASLELWPEATRSFTRALALDASDARLHTAAVEAAVGAATAVRGVPAAFSWGRGEFGVLGHGDTRDKTLPKAVDALRGVHLVDVACGTGHTLVLAVDGDVYAWGWNVKGQCGVTEQEAVVLAKASSPPSPAVSTERRVPASHIRGASGEAILLPTLIAGLVGLHVVGISCGAAHSLAVTADGSVLSWGLGVSGQLGHGDTETCTSPRLIAALASQPVQGVSCGFAHTIALGRDGAIFAWGWNCDGQLGLGDTADRKSPERVEGVPCVAHVACGGAHTALVSKEGALFCFGSNSCGQCGVAAKENGLSDRLSEELAGESILRPRLVFLGYDGHLNTYEDVQASRRSCEEDDQSPASTVLDGPRATSPGGRGAAGRLALRASLGRLATNSGRWKIAEMREALRLGAVSTDGVTEREEIVAMVNELLIRENIGDGLGNDGNARSSGGHNRASCDGNPSCTSANKMAGHAGSPGMDASLSASSGSCAYAACGEEFTLVIRRDRVVLTFGLGIVGQLGDGGHKSRSTAAPVRTLLDEGAAPEVASCGASEAHVVDASGRVWAWGLPATDTQQLALDISRAAADRGLVAGRGVEIGGGELLDGRGQKIHGALPHPILTTKRVLRLDAGRRHFVALTLGASAASSSIELTQIPQAAVGRRLKLEVQARDASGMEVSSGGDRVVARLLYDGGEAALEGEGEAEVTHKLATAEVDDQLNGRYTVSIRPACDGPHQLWVLLNGSHVLGSPLHLFVAAAASTPHAPCCDLSPAVVKVFAGEPAAFVLALRDLRGEAVRASSVKMAHLGLDLELRVTRCEETPGAQVELQAAAMNSEGTLRAGHTPRCGGALPTVQHTFRPDGQIAIEVNTRKAGRFELHASLRGVPVFGSPAAVLFEAAAADARHSECRTTRVTSVAGRSVAVVFACRDAFGNPTFNLHMDAMLRLKNGDQSGLVTSCPDEDFALVLQQRANLSSDGEALIAVSFAPTLSGCHEFVARIAGVETWAVPVLIEPAEPSRRSILRGEGLESCIVSKSALARRSLTLTGVDVFGNICSGSRSASSKITLELLDAETGSHEERAKSSVVYEGDGVWRLDYTAVPGIFTLVVVVDGRRVPPTPRQLIFARDPAEIEAERIAEAKAAEMEARRIAEEEMALAAAAAREAIEGEMRAVALAEDATIQSRIKSEEQEKARRAAQERQVREATALAARREKETTRRAEEALRVLMEERRKQVEMTRARSRSKRTGGGFIVTFDK